MTTPLESGSSAKRNYKLKYKVLKRCIKELVLENAALCDRASEIQHQILVAQEERKFLWKKYTMVQGNNTVQAEDAYNKAVTSSLPQNDVKKQQRKSTLKNGTSKPRQSLTKTKRKRKSEDSVSNDVAAFQSC